MKKAIIILFILMTVRLSFAQTVLLNEDRASMADNKEGPNLKRFSHVFLALGNIVGSDHVGARIKYDGSVNVCFGVRKKFKISPVYSLGYDFGSGYTGFKLKQEQGKILPDTILSKSQRLDYYSFGFGFFNRINFDPQRGNYLGKYFDIGLMGVWNFSVRDVAKNNSSNGTITKTVVRHLPFTNDLGTKLYARIGISHLSFYMTYRITDLFKKSWNYPELPAATAGLELGLF